MSDVTFTAFTALRTALTPEDAPCRRLQIRRASFSSKQPGEPSSEIFHQLPRVGAPHSGHTCHLHRLPRHSSRAHTVVPLPQVGKHRMPGIPRLPGKGEAVVEPSALQASPQADAAAAAAAATPAVAAAPYVTSKMEVEAAENGRPIPKLCCPTCGVTRELELIEQPTGAPKIRYISGPTYVSTGRRGGDFVQKCNCKKCGHFYLTPLPNDDAAATTAASASAGAAAAAPAAPAAETELWMQVQLAAAALAVETELPIEAEFRGRLAGDAAAAAAGGGTPAVAAAPYVTSKMEVEAAENGRPIPKLCCPTCGVTRELELIQQPTGAPKIRYISGPIYVSMGRNHVQQCRCKECGSFSLDPPPNDE